MLQPDTLADLNSAFEKAPEGFLVVDRDSPKFAVISYAKYKSFISKSQNMKKFKNILVTGGAGFIGSVTSRLLEKNGFAVTVLDNLSTGRREAVRGKLIVADLGDRDRLREIFAGDKYDAVMHFAASIEVEESVRNPQKYFENNFINSLNLLGAMAEAGVASLIFSSTAAVYGEPDMLPITENTTLAPQNPYGESKLLFERVLPWYATAHGISSVALRYFNASGAWPEEGLGYNTRNPSHLIPRVLDVACTKQTAVEVFGGDYATPDRSAVRDYIHVLDLASAHILALKKLEKDHGCFIYNVGTGNGYSVMEIIDEAMAVTGQMLPMTMCPRRAGDPAKLVADSTKIQRELGWKPVHDLRSIIRSAWQWHKKH